MKTYAEKLKDPRWQRKRLEVLQAAGWRCQSCGGSNDTLHVHHKRYRKCHPWEYAAGELMCLCEPCHSRLEAQKAEIGAILSNLYPVDLAWVLAAMTQQFGLDPHPPSDQEPVTEADLEEFMRGIREDLDK